MKKALSIIAVLGTVLTGCHNSDIEFPDFEYQTISFAKQSPVRTITLGDDGEYDTSDDNAHRFYIKAVLGGVNVNTKRHTAAFVVDNSMCENLYFDNGAPVLAMPSDYYNIKGDEMVIEKGSVIGGVEVQLTDAYFADPKSVDVTYVVPVRLVSSADSILQGKAKDGIAAPDRRVADHWATQPKDYTFYAVKYKNPYHGCWVSKGKDVIDNRGDVRTIDRQVQLWEKGTLRYLTSKSLSTCVYSFSQAVPCIKADGEPGEKNIGCDLLVTVGDNGAVTIATETAGCTATGSGKWARKGEPKAWGDKDRDLFELNYNFTIDYVYNEQTGEHGLYKYSSEERMVMQSRQNKLEEFKFTVK